MVIERMICLSNGSTVQPVEVRQNDYNVEIRLLVYKTPSELLDMTNMVAVVSYEKDGTPLGSYDSTVENKHYLCFSFPAKIAKEAGKGCMQIAYYTDGSLVHSYTMPFIVEYSIPSPVAGTEGDPAPAFFSLVKEGMQTVEDASEMLENPPRINETNQWELWDPSKKEYEATGKPSIPILTINAATGEPGTDVRIEQSGTTEAPVLTITIPRGEKGYTEGVDLSDTLPLESQAEAKAGTSVSVSREDHVHPLSELGDHPGVLSIQKGGTGAETAEEALENLGAASVQYVAQEVGKKASKAHFTATLSASGWSDTAPYEQTVAVTGLLLTDVPLVDVDMSGATSGDAGTALQEAWTFVGRLNAGDGTVTAYCYEEKPEVDVPIILMVVR